MSIGTRCLFSIIAIETQNYVAVAVRSGRRMKILTFVWCRSRVEITVSFLTYGRIPLSLRIPNLFEVAMELTSGVGIL